MAKKYFTHTIDTAKAKMTVTDGTFSNVQLPYISSTTTQQIIFPHNSYLISGRISAVQNAGQPTATATIDYHILWLADITAGTPIGMTIAYPTQ